MSGPYYKANYPRGSGPDAPPVADTPKVAWPLLMFHGLNDRALHADGLSGSTWNWVVAGDAGAVTGAACRGSG